jgi:Icc-related predicted phosphoesterase
MVLLCLADIHGEGAGLRKVLDEAPEARAIIVVGDVTHLGGYNDARAVLAPILESGRRVLAVAGNMDREGARRFIAEKGIDIHGRGITLGKFGFQGLGGSNPTPFGTPFEVGNEDARRLLAQGHSEITEQEYRVLVSHAPPKDSKLDRTAAGMHVGSQEVRAFLEAQKPDLCVCGHIHEAAGEDLIGDTLCVNVGPYKNGRYALIRIEEGKAEVLWRKK